MCLCLLQDKVVESLSSVKATSSQLHVTAESWLSGDVKASFKVWRRSMPQRGEGSLYLHTHCKFRTK